MLAEKGPGAGKVLFGRIFTQEEGNLSMPDRDDFRCAFKNVLYKSQNREAPYLKQQPSIILIKRQQTSENIHSQQCVLLYISDLYISYMLLKLQLRVQYKIKYIYIYICAAVVLRHRI